MVAPNIKAAGSSNISFGGAQERNSSFKSANAKGYTYRITGSAEIQYLKKQGEDDIILDDYIRNLEIHELYDKADFCFCKLELVIPSNIFRSFQDDYRNSAIKLNIERYSERDRSEDRKPEMVWEKKEFIIMDMPTGAPSEDNTKSGPTSTSKYEGLTVVKMNIIDRDAFKSNKTLFNFVANDVTVGDVLQYGISQCSEGKNIIVGKPDNTTKYEQIFIPPMNFPEMIKYLDKNYGIYKNGAIYFTSITDLIISDRVEKAKSKTDLVTKIKIIFRSQSINGPDAGMYRSTYIERDTALIYLNDRPRISIRDMALKEISGENITVSSKDKTYELQGGGGVKSELPGKEKYYWSTSTRKDLGSALSMDINEGVETISMVCENSDFMIFDIAKDITLEFDYDVNRDYTGTYRFSEVIHVFTPIEPSEGSQDSGKLSKLVSKFKVVRV
jgi:hypothetical protein